MNPKLNPTVSVVKVSDEILEFFFTSIRQQCRIKVQNDLIINVVTSLDGTRSIQEIANHFQIDKCEVEALLEFLEFRGILDNVEPKNDFDNYDLFRRVIHFLAEYSHSHEHLVSMWNNIKKSSVLIIGLGAVGTWVAANLAESGVGTLLLMDADVVEKSNLHRQFGYVEEDIGQKKADVLKRRLHALFNDINVITKYEYLDDDSLHMFDDFKIDLIINCADKPTVDKTSLLVGKYAMERGIPHIIGGGYNLHLSLIGQTVIPGKSACVKCFEKTLEEENKIDHTRVQKLSVKNRKVGSFGPMCSIIASMVGMEAIKVLSQDINPSNLNRRGEFDIYNMDIKYKKYERRDDCEWCGKNGLYYHK